MKTRTCAIGVGSDQRRRGVRLNPKVGSQPIARRRLALFSLSVLLSVSLRLQLPLRLLLMLQLSFLLGWRLVLLLVLQSVVAPPAAGSAADSAADAAAAAPSLVDRVLQWLQGQSFRIGAMILL